MKLYVCYGTWKPAPRPGGHPCGTATRAAGRGMGPRVQRCYGSDASRVPQPDARPREVMRLTGSQWVPALVTDDGDVISGSREIADWAAGTRRGYRRGRSGRLT